jgi:acetoin utilization deacetylase AcuC-like enzyme
MRPRIIFSPKCLGYGQYHVEGPERVGRAAEVLKNLGYDFLEPQPASEDDLLKVHDPDYVWNVKKGLVDDPDTPAYENIFEFARLSTGGAILAAEVGGFSIMRPPGHHAGRSGAALGAYTRGFCYFNNIAVAVKHLGRPTLILDIDGHHGNGTQEIFQGDSTVTYLSLHRSPHYPGTGKATLGNSFNFPLWADCGNEAYLETLDGALKTVNPDKFEVVAVSAGLDTYAGDLASLGLTEKGYGEIGKRIAALNKATFFVLEGGYGGDQNGKNINSLLEAFNS